MKGRISLVVVFLLIIVHLHSAISRKIGVNCCSKTYDLSSNVTFAIRTGNYYALNYSTCSNTFKLGNSCTSMVVGCRRRTEKIGNPLESTPDVLNFTYGETTARLLKNPKVKMQVCNSDMSSCTTTRRKIRTNETSMTVSFKTDSTDDGYGYRCEIKCDELACSDAGPTGPEGTESSFDGSNNFGTDVTFTCTDNPSITFTSTCGASGWSEVSGTCPSRKDECCHTILIEADPEAYISTYPSYRTYLGLFSTTGEITTDETSGISYPAFRSNKNENFWLARTTLPVNNPWIMSISPHVALGDRVGYMFYGPNSTDCPNEITIKQYFDQEDTRTKTESRNISFTCQPACHYKGPATQPNNTTSSYDGYNLVGSHVTFTCTNDPSITFTSTCQNDETWSEVTETCFPDFHHLVLDQNKEKQFSGCPTSGPIQPADTQSNYKGTNSIGTIVTFTCNIDGKTTIESVCMENNEWSPITCSCPVASEAVLGDNTMMITGHDKFND